ncbi:MAG TPA: glycosyltransferase family 2 protein [Anaerolineales bacterium]|nr:glycosyltransferase family 2 protein [Anaerolineales bacterium]
MDASLTSVDVVILSLDREKETLRLLESIAKQRGPEYHVWLVDQGSQPSSLAALKGGLEGFEALTLIELGENTGVAKGRNIGIRAGEAPCIVCIDNDAYFEDPDSLARAAARFAEQAGVGAISFKICEPGGAISRSSWPFGSSVPFTQEVPCLVAQFAGAAHALRREAVHQTELHDEKLFFYWEELDLSYQLIHAGYSILYDPNIRIVHDHSASARLSWKTGRYYYLVRNGLYVRYKYERSRRGFLLYAGGYLLRGLRNGVFVQALRGVRDSLRWVEQMDEGSEPARDPAVLEYVWLHNLRMRGSLVRRFLREALARLPE